jgi:hypothetical protein
VSDRKHTPGPLMYDEGRIEGDDFGGFQILDSAGRAVAHCRRVADARLYCAAPDLLTTCEAVTGLPCVGTDENHDTCGVTYSCPVCQVRNLAHAAIAKAVS